MDAEGIFNLVQLDVPIGDNANIYHRPTPGNGFLETLNQDNVTVSFGTPQGITEKGLITHDGQLIEADAIICATGFDLSYKPRFPIIGRYKIDLADQLEPDAKAYMSLAVPNFPNYLGMISSRLLKIDRRVALLTY